MSNDNGFFHLDWCEFTWHVPEYCGSHEDHLELFFTHFPEFKEISNACEQLPRGYLNYSTVYCYFGSIYLYVHPYRPEMGVHVRVTGSGMYLLPRILHLHSKNEQVLAGRVCKLLLDRGVHFTRIDLAFDDYDKVYTPGDYIQFQIDGRIRSKCQRCRFDFSLTHDIKKGATWYLGSRNNGRFLRVYDKEYESRGEIPAIRYELELKQKYANKVAEVLAEDGSFISFRDLITDMFVVLKPLAFRGTTAATQAEARYRTEVDETFLGIFETQVLRRVPVDIKLTPTSRRFGSTLNWMYHNRRPYKMMIDILGLDHFQRMIDTYEYKDKDLILLEQFRHEYAAGCYSNLLECNAV